MKERKEEFLTPGGISLKAVYSGEDVKGVDEEKMIGEPGEYPFTRGCYSNMYRTFPWMIRQPMGFGTSESTRERWEELIKRGGQRGFKTEEKANTLLFDMPTLFCLDSDNPAAYYQVGKAGVAIDHYKDFVELVRDYECDKGFMNLVVHGSPPIMTAFYIAAAEELGYSLDKLRGSSKNDPFQSQICERISLLPIEAEVKLCLDLLEFCSKYMPPWNPISLEAYGYRSSGCDPVQEIGMTFATAGAYIEGGIKRGLDVDQFVPRISFFSSSGVHLLEEVAKFRATRRVWAKLLKEDFGAKDRRSMLFRTFVCTNPRDYTYQQALINAIRGTIQALAATLGGVQALSVTPYDENHAIPSLESHTLSIRTQQIILEESGIADTVDPLGGSYCIESLTNEIERRIWDYLDRIRSWGDGKFMGGMLKGVKSGYFYKEIEEANLKREKDIRDKAQIVVGLNEYTLEEEVPFQVFKVDKEFRRSKIENLKKYKASRDQGKVKASLEKLEQEAMKEANIMPTLIEVAKEGLTLEECMNVFRKVYGVADFWKGRPSIFKEGK